MMRLLLVAILGPELESEMNDANCLAVIANSKWERSRIANEIFGEALHAYRKNPSKEALLVLNHARTNLFAIESSAHGR